MRCLRCGHAKEAHIRADGACLVARCDGFVAQWPESTQEAAPVEAAAPHEFTEKAE